MKKLWIVWIIVLIIVIVCFIYYLNKNKADNSVNITKNKTDETEKNNNVDNILESKLRISFKDKEIIVSLEKNKTTEDLLNQLPQTLTFEDFSNTEKISYLENKLTYDEGGYKPKRGDLAYYAPWGNLSLFYKDFRHSNNLIKLGYVETGLEYIEKLDGQTVTLELAS